MKREFFTTSLGGKTTAVIFTMGRYDFIVIAEYPSEEAMMKMLLYAEMEGFSDIETMVAIQVEKAVESIKRMP